ncbi:MAG TPA: hypothetical protein PLI96_03800 [Halothiobacillus sp.]|nr:hypothetical protein [Halothiobacillus sp.]
MRVRDIQILTEAVQDDVLRHGIELLELKAPLTLAQFKPALAIYGRGTRLLV